MTQPPLCLQHERVDDLPLLFGVLHQLRLPEILDRHLGSHHLRQGLSYGTLATTWIAYVLSEADHRKSSVEDWARRHTATLPALLHQPVRPTDFSDDRLGIVLRRLHEAAWADLEAEQWQATCEVYQIPVEGIRLDASTTFGYHEIAAEGLMQFGHSKDHRPDLPQLKLMAAAAQPTAHPIACDIVPGNCADDPLYLPLIERVRRQLGQQGLLYLGDCKMAALETRADLVAHGDYYLTVLPRTGDGATLISQWIDEAVSGQHPLQELRRGDDRGQRVVFARACELTRACEATVAGQQVAWTERVQLVRTEALAKHHGEQLERRLRAAEEEIRRLTPAPGRGRQQYREAEELGKAVAEVVERQGVTNLVQVSWHQEEYGAPHRGQDGKVTQKVRYAISAVRRQEEAIQAVKERQAWRVQVTNLSKKRSGLLESVLLYNGGWSVEMFHPHYPSSDSLYPGRRAA